jgi:hypothetical protein
MITGIETVGLGLASFPLVLSVDEHYREDFEALKTWWTFKPNFSRFENHLRLQANFFHENVVELLLKVISSDARMAQLLNGKTWGDPELEASLRESLPKSSMI